MFRHQPNDSLLPIKSGNIKRHLHWETQSVSIGWNNLHILTDAHHGCPRMPTRATSIGPTNAPTTSFWFSTNLQIYLERKKARDLHVIIFSQICPKICTDFFLLDWTPWTPKSVMKKLRAGLPLDGQQESCHLNCNWSWFQILKINYIPSHKRFWISVHFPRQSSTSAIDIKVAGCE